MRESTNLNDQVVYNVRESSGASEATAAGQGDAFCSIVVSVLGDSRFRLALNLNFTKPTQFLRQALPSGCKPKACWHQVTISISSVKESWTMRLTCEGGWEKRLVVY